MNLLTLTDRNLATLHRQTTNEIARRAKAATKDAASIVHGNEMAKRALVVAAAGSHSILFLGPPNCGKTMLRAVALELGLGSTFEARPCPCGYRGDPRRSCDCSYRQIERHKLPQADISIEMVCPPEREMRSAGTGLAEMRQQIKAKTSYESVELGDDSRTLLKAAVSELALDADARNRILAVARTIANLDQCERIEARHICEAINYRMRRF
jgi:predicted ATPase with chaperone activity